MNSSTNNIERPVMIPFFVGYNAAKYGIGAAIVEDNNDKFITLRTCGDDDIWSVEPFTISQREFGENMQLVYEIVKNVNIEDICGA